MRPQTNTKKGKKSEIPCMVTIKIEAGCVETKRRRAGASGKDGDVKFFT
jgi:hypothetical protein